MKNLLEICQQRCSVRAFLPEQPSQSAIEYVMECVRLAPSAVNYQPWHFRYISEKEDLQRLHECYPREWFRTAPACFIAYRDKETEWVRKKDNKPHGDIDVAIATEHLCLAATEQGLGTCWVCNFDVDKCKELFPARPEWEPVVLIPIGTPSDEPTEKKRKAMDEILEIR